MPKGYERMRDSFKRDGMSDAGAKRKAARIHNAANPGNPVGRKTHGKKKKRRAK